MANNFGSTAKTVVTLALKRFVTEHPLMSKVGVDVSRRDALYGDTIKARVAPVLVAEDAIVAGKLSLQPDADMVFETYPVTIDQVKKVNLSFTALELSRDSNPVDLINLKADLLMQGIADIVVPSLIAKATIAAVANETVVAVGAGDYDNIVKVGTALDTRKVPQAGRFQIVDPTLYGEYLLDERVIRSDENSGVTTIQSGVLSGVSGFDIAKYTGMPAALTGAENLRGIAGSTSGLIFATGSLANMLALTDVPATARITDVMEPQSGLRVQLHEWYDANTAQVNCVVVVIYGCAIGKAAGLQRIVSAHIA